jgi:hypothetical protein
MAISTSLLGPLGIFAGKKVKESGIVGRAIDRITGVPSMRKVRDFRMEAMREMYDPTVYNEIATRQRTRATEGLSDLAEQTALRRIASQAARPVDPSIVGGDAARAMSMATTQQAAVNMAYGEIASRLAEMDEQIRAQYGDAYAETVGLQSQIMGMRRAALSNEQAMFEEERSMRRRQLGAQALTGAIGIGGALLGAPGIGGIAGAISQRRATQSLAQARAELMPGEVENFFIEPGEIDLDTDLEMTNQMPMIDDLVQNIDYDAMRMPLPPPRITNPNIMNQPPYVPPVLRRTDRDDMSWLYTPIRGVGKKIAPPKPTRMEIMGGFGPITF